VLALLAQIDLPGLGETGPENVHKLLTVFYVLFGAGFFVALLGHLSDSRVLKATGIALVMLGTLAFVVTVGGHG